MSSGDGMNYRPKSIANKVVEDGEFQFSAIGLDHGHIYGMCEGLIAAGATLKQVYDPDPQKIATFVETFPTVQVAESESQILEDEGINMVASAAVPSDRGPLGVRVMEAGKDYFTDKPPLTTLDQLQQAKDAVAATGKKFAVYYSERLHVESAVYAGQLIKDGAIGRVLQVAGFGPHRLRLPQRPPWFFDKERYGGILIDIGSHQLEQILYFTGATDGHVGYSQVANHNNPQYPGLDDFGDATIVTNNGASGYFRCDWFTPDGLQNWGDGRTIILGTEGFIELRKYLNIGTDEGPDNVFLANGEGEFKMNVSGKVGFPFFGELIVDSLEGTEVSMPQEHTFKAIELAIKAQNQAVDISNRG